MKHFYLDKDWRDNVPSLSNLWGSGMSFPYQVVLYNHFMINFISNSIDIVSQNKDLHPYKLKKYIFFTKEL